MCKTQPNSQQLLRKGNRPWFSEKIKCAPAICRPLTKKLSDCSPNSIRALDKLNVSSRARQTTLAITRMRLWPVATKFNLAKCFMCCKTLWTLLNIKCLTWREFVQEKGRAGELLDSPSQTVETKTSKSILIQVFNWNVSFIHSKILLRVGCL